MEEGASIYQSQRALGLSNEEALQQAFFQSKLESSSNPYSEQIQEIYQEVFNTVGYIERLKEETRPPKKHKIRIFLSKLRSIRHPVDNEYLDISIVTRLHICAFSVLFQRDPLQIFVSSVSIVIFSLSAMGIHPGKWKNENFQDLVDVVGVVSFIGLEVVAVKNIVELFNFALKETSDLKMFGGCFIIGFLLESYLVLIYFHVKKWTNAKLHSKVVKQKKIHPSLPLEKWKKLARILKIYEERIWHILEKSSGKNREELEDLWEVDAKEKEKTFQSVGCGVINHEPLFFPIVLSVCDACESPHRFDLQTLLNSHTKYNLNSCPLDQKAFRMKNGCVA